MRVKEEGRIVRERERVQILISWRATHGLVRLKEGLGLHLQPKSPLTTLSPSRYCTPKNANNSHYQAAYHEDISAGKFVSFSFYVFTDSG